MQKKTRLFYLLVAVMLVASVVLAACTPTATEEVTPPTTAPSPIPPTDVPPAPTEVPLGTPENPVILAFAPSVTSEQITDNGEPFAAKLAELTGYTIKIATPTNYAALVEAMGSGNAHIALFPTFAYLLAKEKGYADVGLVAVRFGSDHYGAQFVANVTSGFTPYFDTETNTNTADAATALAQFQDKKPCWTDPLSVSGYIIPSGILNNNGITTKAAAFVQGHPTVITALYAGGICDFGATFIDARTNSALADKPDVMEKVVVIWRTPPVIPNDNVSFATSMPDEMKAKFIEAYQELASTDEGKALMMAIYQIDSWSVQDDTFYDEFRVYLEASGFDWQSQVK